MIKIYDETKYFLLIEKFDLIPFTQSQSWYKYLKSRGENLVLFVDSENNPQIAFVGIEKKILLINRKLLIIDTPLIKHELSDKSITKRFSDLMQYGYYGIEMDSIMQYDVKFEIGVRRAGFVRPLGFTRCPLTLFFEFKNQFNFDKSWKNNIKKAENSGVSAIEILNPKLQDAEIFCDLFQETRKKKNLSYEFYPQNILDLLVIRDFRLFFAFYNKNVVSAHIVYVNNNVCYSVFRANGFASRNIGASHYLYNHVLNKLKSEGNNYYDFGRIPPSNHATDSVYTFKIGSRGEKIQYNGEWTYYKKKYREYLVNLGMTILRGKSRY